MGSCLFMLGVDIRPIATPIIGTGIICGAGVEISDEYIRFISHLGVTANLFCFGVHLNYIFVNDRNLNFDIGLDYLF